MSATGVSAKGTGEANMAHCEVSGVDANASCETFYELGLTHACGRSGTADLVSAHKWFNIAAYRGFEPAKHSREEVAAEMDRSQIAAAQRAARDWITSH